MLTRHGTLVGPLMNDITGYPELTPYRGGWAGNDYPASLTAGQKARARQLTYQLGGQLAGEGYLGFFEVDYLVDTQTGELYLGELNPRISGISPVTNVTAGAYADMPLVLFHLLEYLDLDYEIDVGEINERWSQEAAVDVWSQIIIKETSSAVDLITNAPRSGIYTLAPDGTADFRRPANDWHGIVRDSEAFYLRILVGRRLPVPGRRPGCAGDPRPAPDRRQPSWNGAAWTGSPVSAVSSAELPSSRCRPRRRSGSRSRWPEPAGQRRRKRVIAAARAAAICSG